MPDAHALETISDEALARTIAAGPPAATAAEEAELYRRFAPRVRLYGRRHLQNETAAEDLAQDVLLLTIERLRAGEVQQPEDIGSFILGTSRMMANAQRRVARAAKGLPHGSWIRFRRLCPRTSTRWMCRGWRRACVLWLTAIGWSCCSRSMRIVKRRKSLKRWACRRARSARFGTARWHACATA
jgi:hypothetical protein